MLGSYPDYFYTLYKFAYGEDVKPSEKPKA